MILKLLSCIFLVLAFLIITFANGNFLPKTEKVNQSSNILSLRKERMELAIVVDWGSTRTGISIWTWKTVASLAFPQWKIEKDTVTQLDIQNEESFRSLRNFLNSKLEDGNLLNYQDVYNFITPVLDYMYRTFDIFLSDSTNIQVFRDIPVITHGTAGVRGLPVSLLSSLFKYILMVINLSNERNNYNFFTTPEFCRMISGEEEAIYSHLTFTKLYSHSMKDKYVFLEIGGASTQVYCPNCNVKTIYPSPESYLLDQDLFESNHYLSLLNAGYKRVLAITVFLYCHNNNNLDDQGFCHHPCFPKGYERNSDCNMGYFGFKSNPMTASGGCILDEIIDMCNNPSVGLNEVEKTICAKFSIPKKSDKNYLPSCKGIKGSGSFKNCFSIVRQYIFQRALPGNDGYNISSALRDLLFHKLSRRNTEDHQLTLIFASGVFSSLLQEHFPNLTNKQFVNEDGYLSEDIDILSEVQAICEVSVVPPSNATIGKYHLHNAKNGLSTVLHGDNFDICLKSTFFYAFLVYLQMFQSSSQVLILHKTTEKDKASVEYSWGFGRILDLITSPKWVEDVYSLGAFFFK